VQNYSEANMLPSRLENWYYHALPTSSLAKQGAIDCNRVKFSHGF
jgi:hypothetical protein